MRRSLICHQAGGDPQPNTAPTPREDEGSQGPTAPQGFPLPWGTEAYQSLHLVLVQYPWCIIFTAKGGHSEG